MHPRIKSFLLFIVYVVVSQALDAGLSLLLFRLQVVNTHDLTWRPSIFIWWQGAGAVTTLAATWLVVRLGRKRFADFGYAGSGAARQLMLGSLWGFFAVAVLVAVIAALGGFSPGQIAMSGTRLATYVACWLMAFFGVGLAEEMTFRSTGLLTLAEAIGFWPAAIATSLIFAGLHYFRKGPVENIADAVSVEI